ncbi:PilZ domain-containing protein [Treponema pedis]|nr:PilZ domain-containing protein [Treponema pedis]QSI05489.1 PilZ domain-containing protein [Treponema pedis]
MAFASSQQLNRYYDLYKDIDVTFSREVILALNLDPRQAFIRCSGGQWPCIINSASMTKAKIICGKKSGFIEKLKAGTTAISLRFTFFEPEAKDTLSFFVSAKLIGISSYEAGNHELVLISLEYTQRAPDDLIEKLGILLEANINSKKRQYDRVVLNVENSRKIGLVQKETVVFVDGIPRRCILRDISFSGAKILLVGVANFLINKDVTVRFTFEDPPAVFGIKGKSLRAEHVEGRKDLVAIAIDYYSETIPMMYKMYLNRYFSVVRKPQAEEDGENIDNQIQQTDSLPAI